MAKPATKPKDDPSPAKAKSPATPGDNSVSPDELKAHYRDMLLIRRFEEREKRAVVHLIKRMQHAGLAPAFGFVDLERLRQRQLQKILVELARCFGVPAAVGVVMQSVYVRHDVFSGYHRPKNLPSL